MEDEKEIEKNVVEIIDDYLDSGVERIVPSASLTRDLGADTLDRIGILMAIESEYMIAVPDERFENVDTVQDLIDLTKEYVSQGVL